MKKICILIAMCLCIWVVKASDFQVGKLHYKIVSVPDLTVEVTYPNDVDTHKKFPHIVIKKGTTFSSVQK